jgi:hypothetical protein
MRERIRDIPAAFLNEVQQKEYRQALLIKLDLIDAILYFTNFDTHILHDSTLYYPRSFHIQPVNYGNPKIVDDVSVSIDDVDRGIFASLGNKDSAVYPFTLTWVVVNREGQEIAALDIFVGEVDQWEYAPGRVDLTISSIFSQWARETTSKYSASCRWRVFKGLECKYDGVATVCDRTYDQCSIYDNVANFGGFRWLPSMVNKRIEEKK